MFLISLSVVSPLRSLNISVKISVFILLFFLPQWRGHAWTWPCQSSLHTTVFLLSLSLQLLEWVNICVLPLPSFLPATWLLFSWASLWWCPSDQPLGCQDWRQSSFNYLTEETRAREWSDDLFAVKQEVGASAGLEPGDPDSYGRVLSPIASFPTLFLLGFFFCPPFSGISFWASGWYLSLVLLLLFRLFFWFFPSSSFSRFPTWSVVFGLCFPPLSCPWGSLSVFGIWVVTSMWKAPNALSRLLQ